MNVNKFENIIENIVDEFDVEIVDDEIIYNIDYTSSFFYIDEFQLNLLINDENIKKDNENKLKLIDEFVEKIYDEINDIEFNIYIHNNEIEIELIDDEFEFENVDEYYDDLKICF